MEECVKELQKQVKHLETQRKEHQTALETQRKEHQTALETQRKEHQTALEIQRKEHQTALQRLREDAEERAAEHRVEIGKMKELIGELSWHTHYKGTPYTPSAPVASTHSPH